MYKTSLSKLIRFKGQVATSWIHYFYIYKKKIYKIKKGNILNSKV